MAEPMDANEAVQMALAIGNCMLKGDKESREIIYSDLTTKDLQRVLRWQTRFLLQHMAILCANSGIDIHEGYAAWQTTMTQKALNGEFY